MEADLERLVRALIESDYQSKKARKRAKHRCTVTVSRGYGCGGEPIAEELAQRLEVAYYDREIVDAVARAAHVERPLMERLDERVEGMRTAWLASIISAQSAMTEDYRRNLVNVVLGIGRRGGVIVGRGANLILSAERVFRIRVVGSLSVCAGRIAERDRVELKAAEKRVIEIEHERARFIRELFGRDIDDTTTFDLVINTDRFSHDQALQLILVGMRFAGFHVPDRAFRRLDH